MKIRHGFISNSSSTSFVIAYKKGKKCEHCNNWIELSEWDAFFEGREYEEKYTRISASGKDSVIEEMKEAMEGSWWEERTSAEEFSNLVEDIINRIKFVDEGEFSIAFVEIDNGDLDSFYNSLGERIIASQSQMHISDF